MLNGWFPRASAVIFFSLLLPLVTVEQAVAIPSIQLLTLGDGSIAKWTFPPNPQLATGEIVVTYRIDNKAGVSASVVQAVRDAIAAWNAKQNVYELVETTGTVNIVIELYFKITPGFILGFAEVTGSGGSISSARVALGVKGLALKGVQNLAGHELGHALGLGHANVKNDLMEGALDSQERRKSLLCISNLDVGGLTAIISPFTVTTWVCT